MNCVVAVLSVVLVTCCDFCFFEKRKVNGVGVTKECGVDMRKFWFGCGINHVNKWRHYIACTEIAVYYNILKGRFVWVLFNVGVHSL